MRSTRSFRGSSTASRFGRLRVEETAVDDPFEAFVRVGDPFGLRQGQKLPVQPLR